MGRRRRAPRTAPPLLRKDDKGEVLEVAGTTPLKQGRIPDTLAFDIGEVTEPIRSWDDLKRLLPPSRATQIEDASEAGRRLFMALRYTRSGQLGVLGVQVSGSPPMIAAVESASRDLDVLTLRASGVRNILAEKHIVICGCGAIGSFTADLLARSGVGALHLIDPEVFRPGNGVRHLLRAVAAGVPKVDGVRQSILQMGLMDDATVVALRKRITSLDDAVDALETGDLLIDTTASGPLAAMFSDAQASSRTSILSVGLFRYGAIARVDRFPLAEGEVFLPGIPSVIDAALPLLEAGCGDPVFPTPPSSVVSAAALATRLVVRLLSGEGVPATTIEVYTPQSDAPYDAVGTLE
jgi:molybdopterin/thiamine biosynthesis adenylyltransferase